MLIKPLSNAAAFQSGFIVQSNITFYHARLCAVTTFEKFSLEIRCLTSSLFDRCRLKITFRSIDWRTEEKCTVSSKVGLRSVQACQLDSVELFE